MANAPLEIKVVYPVSARSRRAAVSAPASSPARVRPSTARVGRAGLLGALSLLIAFGVYFVTWWQVDSFIYRKLMMNTPIRGLNAHPAVVAKMMGMPYEASATPIAPVAGPAWYAKEFFQAPVFAWIPYLWLTLTTVGFCLLALAAGSCLGVRAGPDWRRKWFILMIGAASGMAWNTCDAALQYGWGFPPDRLRWSMGGLLLFVLLLGLSLGSPARRLSRVASGVLILSGLGSSIGLYLWGQAGAVDAKFSSITFLLLVFIVHSFYGWVLWPLSGRWAR